jgi:hypothetical protein
MLRTMRLFCWLALPVGALLVALNGAAAQGSPEVREACTPDAMRVCSDFIPDVPKITACMKAKHAQLSEACRLAMSHGHQGRKHRAHRWRGHVHCGHGRHCG